MSRRETIPVDILDEAVDAVRKTQVPDGPPQPLPAALIAAGNDLDPTAWPGLAYQRKMAVGRAMRVFIAATAVAVVVGLASAFLYYQRGNVVLAGVIKQIRNAKSATWTTEVVRHDWNRDKSKTWLERNRNRLYYKAPGRQRTERLDEQGQVESVVIDDAMAGKHVEFLMKSRRARTIDRTPLPAADQKSLSDPLSRLRAKLDGNSTALGTKRLDGREVIGFHVLQDKSRPDSGADLWVDAQSGRLVYVLLPGAYKYDPETDPIRDNPPDKAYFREPVALIIRDIAFDVNLDDSLFHVEAPKSFSNEMKTKHEPTEKDVVEWLGVLAQAHGGVFPPQIKESIGKLNEFSHKNERDRTRAEDKLVQQQSLADQGLVHPYPIVRFVARLPRDDWHYQGNGVKQGDRSKAIFWYRPKGLPKFRVVYGDLSVKDVAPAELPKAN